MKLHRLALLGALLPLTVAACAEDEQLELPEVHEPAPEPEPPAPTPEPLSCAEVGAVHQVDRAQNNLLFVLDRSASMHKRVDDSSDTRWTLTTAGLFELLDSMPSDAHGGLTFFPKGAKAANCCRINKQNLIDCSGCASGEKPPTGSKCEAETYTKIPTGIAPLDATQVQAIKDKVTQSDGKLFLGTPMVPALSGVLESLSANPLPGVTSLVLLTDGLPAGCGSDNDLKSVIKQVGAGQAQGLRTYVVGIDATGVGDDASKPLAPNLSKIAKAAGTGRYVGCEQDNECAHMVNIDNFEASLETALTEVALAATSCAFDFPQVADGQVDLVNTTVSIATPGGATTSVARDTSHTDGWDLLPGGQQVQLYGGACEQLKSDGEAVVEIVVGCSPS
jgi:hypothetical protein